MIKLLNIYKNFIFEFMKQNKFKINSNNITIINSIIGLFVMFLIFSVYILLSISIDIDKGGF